MVLDLVYKISNHIRKMELQLFNEYLRNDNLFLGNKGYLQKSDNIYYQTWLDFYCPIILI